MKVLKIIATVLFARLAVNVVYGFWRGVRSAR